MQRERATAFCGTAKIIYYCLNIIILKYLCRFAFFILLEYALVKLDYIKLCYVRLGLSQFINVLLHYVYLSALLTTSVRPWINWYSKIWSNWYIKGRSNTVITSHAMQSAIPLQYRYRQQSPVRLLSSVGRIKLLGQIYERIDGPRSAIRNVHVCCHWSTTYVGG